eukprot:GHVS01065153.1.p1 GENE.GHVS01065153.1~~GHVS01065153.1.p1  ORF type:complete len:112 (-),score=8.03 GHVS01065153.1:13-348(-)
MHHLMLVLVVFVVFGQYYSNATNICSIRVVLAEQSAHSCCAIDHHAHIHTTGKKGLLGISLPIVSTFATCLSHRQHLLFAGCCGGSCCCVYVVVSMLLCLCCCCVYVVVYL